MFTLSVVVVVVVVVVILLIRFWIHLLFCFLSYNFTKLRTHLEASFKNARQMGRGLNLGNTVN